MLTWEPLEINEEQADAVKALAEALVASPEVWHEVRDWEGDGSLSPDYASLARCLQRWAPGSGDFIVQKRGFRLTACFRLPEGSARKES